MIECIGSTDACQHAAVVRRAAIGVGCLRILLWSLPSVTAFLQLNALVAIVKLKDRRDGIITSNCDYELFLTARSTFTENVFHEHHTHAWLKWTWLLTYGHGEKLSRQCSILSIWSYKYVKSSTWGWGLSTLLMLFTVYVNRHSNDSDIIDLENLICSLISI